MSVIVRLETRDEIVEKRIKDDSKIDEYLLADALVIIISAFHAQSTTSGSYIHFIRHFNKVFREKFEGELDE